MIRKPIAVVLLLGFLAAGAQGADLTHKPSLELGTGLEQWLAIGGSSLADSVYPSGLVVFGRIAGAAIAARVRAYTSDFSLFAGIETAGPLLVGSSFGVTLETGTVWGEVSGGWRFELRALRLTLEGYYRMTVNRGAAGSMHDGGVRLCLGYEF